MFSKACEYGIRATLFIATQSGQQKQVNLKQIAKEIDSPVAFTAKILQKLSKEGIISSIQGPTGGYFIDDSVFQVLKIRDIIDAIDGNSIYTDCILGLPNCSDAHPCPVHHQFFPIRTQLLKLLDDNISTIQIWQNEGR
jgi:Rrf2 family protein